MVRTSSCAELLFKRGELRLHQREQLWRQVELAIPDIFEIAGKPEKISVVRTLCQLEKIIAVGLLMRVIDQSPVGQASQGLQVIQPNGQPVILAVDGPADLLVKIQLENIF